MAIILFLKPPGKVRPLRGGTIFVYYSINRTFENSRRIPDKNFAGIAAAGRKRWQRLVLASVPYVRTFVNFGLTKRAECGILFLERTLTLMLLSMTSRFVAFYRRCQH